MVWNVFLGGLMGSYIQCKLCALNGECVWMMLNEWMVQNEYSLKRRVGIWGVNINDDNDDDDDDDAHGDDNEDDDDDDGLQVVRKFGASRARRGCSALLLWHHLVIIIIGHRFWWSLKLWWFALMTKTMMQKMTQKMTTRTPMMSKMINWWGRHLTSADPGNFSVQPIICLLNPPFLLLIANIVNW